MKNLFPFSIIIILVLCISCTRQDCPEDRDLGALEYSENSLSFTGFDRCSLITFENSQGELIQLRKGEKHEFMGPRYCIETGECDGFWNFLSGRRSCDYYMIKYIDWRYTSEYVGVYYNLSFINLETSEYDSGDTSHYVEYFSVSYSPPYNNLHLVTNLRGKDYRSREDSLSKNDYVFLPEKQFWNKTFYDLYTDNENIWFNKENGIVAFKYRDDLYRWVDCD